MFGESTSKKNLLDISKPFSIDETNSLIESTKNLANSIISKFFG